ADLNRGAVTFTHTLGSPSVDTFRFRVTNAEPGSQPLSGSFTIIASDPADELVHLPLDEGGGSSAGDASGHGNNGTLTGGATFETDTPDGSASAVRLDGASAAIDLPAIDATGSGLTTALWFKADSFATSDARLVSKASGTAASQHVFMISTVKVGNEFRLRARLRLGGDTTTIIAPGGTLTTGDWRHAALTHDGDIARLYLDGIEVASTVLAGAIDTDPSVPVAIGAQPAGAGGRHFDGLVDDVHILQRALTRTEVAMLAGQGT
ncbi:MAG: LamG domain-containing protein, partial [Acidimicrobiales bacterium]